MPVFQVAIPGVDGLMPLQPGRNSGTAAEHSKASTHELLRDSRRILLAAPRSESGLLWPNVQDVTSFHILVKRWQAEPRRTASQVRLVWLKLSGK